MCLLTHPLAHSLTHADARTHWATQAMAEAMRKLRSDATRLGLGPFSQWRQLTSGAHAVLLFTQMCHSISLYGFTTFATTKARPYTTFL